jgi:hypothetical protein
MKHNSPSGRTLEVVVTGYRTLLVTEKTSVSEVIDFVAAWKPDDDLSRVQRCVQAIFRVFNQVQPGENAGMGIG